MLEGSFKHEDFCGHKGTINPGDLQVREFVYLYFQPHFTSVGGFLVVDDSWAGHPAC